MKMRGLSFVAALIILGLGGEAAAQGDQPPIGDQPTPTPTTPTPPPTTTPPPATTPPPPPPITAPPQTPPPTAGDREDPPGAPVRVAAPAPVAPAAPAADPDAPVVRAAAGNMGMYFRFGGLATLLADGNTRNVGPVAFTQVGLKFVLSESWMVPLYFSTGIRLDSVENAPDPNDADSGEETNWGLEVGSGFEYHFRVWRRISPFFGLNVGVGFEDPTGEDNLKFGVGLGPILGVEYYIGDRVSLTAMYMVVIQIGYQEQPGAQGPFGPTDSNDLTTFSFTTMAGGALNLTYYF